MMNPKIYIQFPLAVIGMQALNPSGYAAESNRPNIIFIIADDMTRDMFNFLPEGKGKNLSPNLDRLAREGVIMNQQHVSATVSTPSRYNCLTGNYASRAHNPEFLASVKKNGGQRVVEWNTHIMPNDPNLASILKNAGYFTGAVGKNHVIEVDGWKEVPLTADFSDPSVKKTQLNNYRKTIEAYHACGFDFADGIFYENPDFNGPRELAVHNIDWSTEAALRFIDQSGDDPFFLYFATTLPHGPTEADRSWNADRTITPLGRIDQAPRVMPDKSTIPVRLKEANIPFNNKKANLLWLDDALGALLNKIEETGKAENTIIFFFNDQGQYAKGSIYQGATRSPSVIWKKGGFPVGHECNTMVSNIDFAPTILELTHVDTKGMKFDGVSFAPVLEGQGKLTKNSLFFEIGYTKGVRVGNYKYIAIRYPEWIHKITLEERKKILEDYNHKLAIRGKQANNEDPNAPFGHLQIIPGGGDAEFFTTQRYKHYAEPDQLYDLATDPEESVNLVSLPGYQEVLQKMKSQLKAYLDTLPGCFGEFVVDCNSGKLKTRQ